MSSAPVFQNSKLEDCKDNCFLHHIVLTPTLMTTADYHITQTSQMENIVSNCYFHYFPKEHPHTLVLITPSHPATLLNSLNSLFPYGQGQPVISPRFGGTLNKDPTSQFRQPMAPSNLKASHLPVLYFNGLIAQVENITEAVRATAFSHLFCD